MQKTVCEIDIKLERKAKGLSQMKLAKACGVSLTAVQLWENGCSSPTPANLKKLQEALGLQS